MVSHNSALQNRCLHTTNIGRSKTLTSDRLWRHSLIIIQGSNKKLGLVFDILPCDDIEAKGRTKTPDPLKSACKELLDLCNIMEKKDPSNQFGKCRIYKHISHCNLAPFLYSVFSGNLTTSNLILDEQSSMKLGNASQLTDPQQATGRQCHALNRFTVKRGANFNVDGHFCLSVNDFAVKSGVSLLFDSFGLSAGKALIERDATISVSGKSGESVPLQHLPSVPTSSTEKFAGGAHASLGGGWYLSESAQCQSPFSSYKQPATKGYAGRGSASSKGGSTIRLKTHVLHLEGTLRANGVDVFLDSVTFPSGNSNIGAGAGSGGSVWITASGSFDGQGQVSVDGGSCKVSNYSALSFHERSRMSSVASSRCGAGSGGRIAVEAPRSQNRFKGLYR